MLAESLPGKLYHYWLHSAIFSLLQRMYRAVRHVYLHSGAHALLTHESAVQRAYASSLFARLLRALFRGILWLCGRILDFFGRVNAGGINHRLWLRFGRTSRFLKYDFLFGGFLCCMFLCPHDFWSNTYALLAAAGFLVLLFFAAARKRQALPDFSLFGLPFFLFLCACVLSLAFTRDLGDSVRVLMFYLTSFLLCFLAAGAAADRKTLMTVLGFAIEIGQRITGTGEMDMSDVISGLYGVLVFFLIYSAYRIVVFIIRRIARRVRASRADRWEERD